MIIDYDEYVPHLRRLVQTGVPKLSDIKPSEWVEQNVIMGLPFPGPYKYSRTPYCREIIDCLSPDHPARKIAIMKGAQIGLSAGVLIPALGWIIKESPGNTYFTVGAPDLIDKSVEKMDIMIDNAGLRPLIRPQIMRRKAQKSGDTNTKKDFAGGFINITTPNNHKEWRDVSLKYGFVDDFEAAKSSSKESGSTRKLIEQRFAAYADSHKIYYISTPENKADSNIEQVYLLGDQRKYLIPCPCCGEMIELRWSVIDGGITGGIFWKLDEQNKLIENSVGYICQKCGGFFDDKNKHELLNAGHWQPTAEPSSPDYYSYHISSLYAPLGMYDWKHYVRDWIEANPTGQPRKDKLHKTFLNVVLGETYAEDTESPKANSIQKNIRDYDICTVPDTMSMADGNGNIVMLTCGADLNGKEDDARLDYEILAWSETGACYSIDQGSIGTFLPRMGNRWEDRKIYTYDFNGENSVWPEFERVLSRMYQTDTGREMGVMIAGLDCGHYSNYAYQFIDTTNAFVKGVKGEKEDKYRRFGVDVRIFKPALERLNLFILQVGVIKDHLGEYMQLNWAGKGFEQPANFMNFPQPSVGKYGFSNYFEHFESEHRVAVKDENGENSQVRWVKKSSTSQNHFWDCRVYNMAIRDIMVDLISKEVKQKMSWTDFVKYVKGE